MMAFSQRKETKCSSRIITKDCKRSLEMENSRLAGDMRMIECFAVRKTIDGYPFYSSWAAMGPFSWNF